MRLHVTVFYDSSDPADPGWAWRARTGPHEESGRATDVDDAILQARTHVPEIPRVLSRKQGWTYHDHGGAESFQWEGERATREAT